MRAVLLFLFLSASLLIFAQRECGTEKYVAGIALNADVASRMIDVENFIQNSSHNIKSSVANGKAGKVVIRVPVVVHVLYNASQLNISDEQIKTQLDALNRDFRRQNSDTTNTPARFKSLAADVQIEFALATADPKGRGTNGIVRKQTTVTEWNMDDKIKFSASGGDDAWDSRYYLNIWVGKMRSLLGYSSAPAGPVEKDGLVINVTAFGTQNVSAPYNMGRTVVHEAGHWMGLKHIWGDTYCGDDTVDDTPKQGGFTSGCPTSFRTSCNNGEMGDMYMNYMDFTNDACMNLFTEGQKHRMRTLFQPGGPKSSFLISKGLNNPWAEAAPVVEPLPNNASLIIYPNPAINELILSFENDTWLGKELRLVSINGSVLQKIKITSKLQKINISKLQAGVYVLQGENGNQKLREKFIKL
ncbi:MAG: zinc-dependent metalloprotease [Chitinophagaceae bacterium]